MPERIIGTGELGGKARGLLRTQEFLAAAMATPAGARYKDIVAVPRTAHLATDIFRIFIAHNHLEEIVHSALADPPCDFDDLRDAFLVGTFPPHLLDALDALLAEFAAPLAVRSSSLLEDQKNASFAGKYESVLIGNRGTRDARRAALVRAIATVYASTYNPSARAYRRKRNLMDATEEMAVMVQEVVGRAYGHYYLPALAGVAFSQNGYCWHRDIRKKDGLVRLVFGLGSRAVGRGYVRLFSPAKPESRPEGTEVNNIQKCSQKEVDVIDLDTGASATVHFRELIKNGFECYPGAQSFVALRDGNYLYRPVSNLWDPQHIPVLTLDGALAGAWMGLNISEAIRWLLATLEEQSGAPVDMEFAIDVDPTLSAACVYVLQVRPLAQRTEEALPPWPALCDDDVIMRVQRNLPTAFVPDLEYVVYVDEAAYHAWPAADRASVARAIGRLNKALADARFMLVGPGRWGSWNALLGVPVNYVEIANCAMLVEVARRRAMYVPEVSYGSHFFQDLIEDNIAYLPLYPDEPDEMFNEAFFAEPSWFASLLSDEYFRRFDGLIKVIHVPSVAGGRKAHALLDGAHERAVVYLA